MKRNVVGLLLLAVIGGPLIGGCSAIGALHGRGSGSAWAAIPISSDRGADRVADLLAYAVELRRMSPEQLASEFHGAQASYTREPDGVNRLRLVVLLTLPDAPFHDDDRAIGMLDAYLDNPGGDPAALQNFAALLRSTARRRVDDARSLAAERSRSDLLRKKIDELKSIEKSINDRGKPSVQELK